MNRISSVATVVLCAIFFLSLISCTKEIIKETVVQKDSIIVRRDSIIIKKQDVAKFLKKKWSLQSHEIEQYAAGLLVNKNVENFVSNNFYVEFKTAGTYTSVDRGGTTNGTYELLDDNYYVLDKGTVNERYYYILTISETAFINRGPFTKTNQLLTNYLFSAYFKSTL